MKSSWYSTAHQTSLVLWCCDVSNRILGYLVTVSSYILLLFPKNVMTHAIRYLVMVSSYMLLIFPKNVMTHAIRYPVMVSSYMLLLFPKNVTTHTSVHQTICESGCRWSNLSIVGVQLHQIHLFAVDIDTC